MILHSPLRFGEAAMVGMEIGYFGDERHRSDSHRRDWNVWLG
jgi:hypothetical protein